MAHFPTPRPFLKWVGGKSQLLPHLMQRVPGDFGTYHEPFLGGGALYFGLQRQGRIERAMLSDINWELIDSFRAVRDYTGDVLDRLEKYRHTEKFFYKLRSKNPKYMRLPNRAARMIYLNKTCYNGLYRVNSKGKFNAPFGRYKNPRYRDPENLHAVSHALQPAKLLIKPFARVLTTTQPGDFVYFDPPYVPLSPTANFTAYSPGGFGLHQHVELRDVVRELTKRNVRVMVSNSSADTVYELYDEFNIEAVYARRAINSNANKRGKLPELVITNF